MFSKAWTAEATRLWDPIACGVSKNTSQNWKISTLGQCDGLLVAILTSKLNSNGDSTCSKILTRMVSKESMSCRCCDNDVLVSYCVEGVFFKDRISGVGSEFLSPKRLLIWVFLGGLDVISSVRSADVAFPWCKRLKARP